MTPEAIQNQHHATQARSVYDATAFGAFLTGKAGETGVLSETDWRLAREVAKRQGVTDLKALLDLGLLGEDALADAYARWSGLPRWKPDDETAPISESAPLEFMKRNAALVLAEGDTAPRIILADPADHFLRASLAARFGEAARFEVGCQKDITRFLEERLREEEQGEGDAGADHAIDVSSELAALRDLASEAPVIRFFNQAVERAMELGASDIHLERYDRRISLRFRVDGILVEQPPPPPAMYEPLLCRVKIMSKLDIAERRRAQDGRIRLRLRGRSVDMRVSIVPTMYGQDAAIRLQDRQKLADLDLTDLGFNRTHIDRLMRVAAKSHGILLITGPTGSGKTTTLYAILRQLVTSERKIVTVEDPVEYAMDGVNQIPVNPAIDLNFSNTLRHILRHDPDVILIGEIRDRETGEIAFQASLTGHMVLSTLHTNDVPSTFVRLVDMGIEPYLVNAAVEGVSAQRLLRRLCPACGRREGEREGCRTCGGIGYRGRTGVMEFSPVTPKVKRAMLDDADERTIRAALAESGYVPMRSEAERLVRDGVTDEAEVARVLGAPADLDLAAIEHAGDGA